MSLKIGISKVCEESKRRKEKRGRKERSEEEEEFWRLSSRVPSRARTSPSPSLSYHLLGNLGWDKREDTDTANTQILCHRVCVCVCLCNLLLCMPLLNLQTNLLLYSVINKAQVRCCVVDCLFRC